MNSFTERDIQSALTRTLAGLTRIVIAHRLATLRNADCVPKLGQCILC